MLVKICGLTRAEDALLAAQLGATHLGFIFADSPRKTTAENAAGIRMALEEAGYIPRVKTVGVFVNSPVEELEEIVRTAGLDFVQLHGDETPQYTEALNCSWYRALRVSEENCASLDVSPWVTDGELLLADALVRGAYGGTGERIAVAAAVTLRDRVREAGGCFVLAGGLNPENISGAVVDIRPDGVDVSSGVEDRPGVKSAERLRSLFRALAPFRIGGR